MDFLEKTVLRFFDQLSDPWKLILLLLLVAALIGLAIWKYRGWHQQRSLKKELTRAKSALRSVTLERDQLQKRIESLDIVDSHVWTRPDSFKNDRFVDAESRGTRFLAFCNLKGGVGKTTLTVNLGACLALRGKRVLLVDLDFQGTMSNLVLDRLIEYRRKGWTTDTLLNPEVHPDVIRSHSFPVPGVPNCRAMVANESLEVVEFAQQARFYVNERHEVRFCFQKAFHAEVVFNEYDYVMFDCPPRLSASCVNALACADFVITPTSLAQGDIDAVPRTLNWLRMLRPVIHADFLGAVICRCNMRSGRLIKFEERQLGSLTQIVARHLPGSSFVFEAKIPVKPIINQAASTGKPAALDPLEGRPLFEAVTEELERRIHR